MEIHSVLSSSTMHCYALGRVCLQCLVFTVTVKVLIVAAQPGCSTHLVSRAEDVAKPPTVH